MSNLPKIIVLTGPTASGKTALSLKLAQKFGGEIVSADSRQVYRGLDVGTDKVKDQKGITHHLLDVASPKRTFTAAQYQTRAAAAIKQILKKGKVPIVVGGTGFYIEALIYNLSFPKVKPNHLLRSMLRSKTAKELLTLLERLDPERANGIDKQNKVRLIRAIEIANSLGSVPAASSLNSHSSPYNPLILGLAAPDNILKQRINRRVDRRFNAIAREIRRLRAQKLSFKRLVSLGLEYRFVSYYLLGKMRRQEAARKLKTATWQFAKRQKTYFKRLPIIWIQNQGQAEKKINSFFNQ